MSVVAIVQARMGSTRLPGKVLKELSGKSVLAWCIGRLKEASLVDRVVIATTDKDSDLPIVTLCEEQGWDFYRGDEADVLDRYYQAALKFKAETVIRVTSDCPLIDPWIVNHFVAAFHSAYPAPDYLCNLAPRTYPRGMDTEVFTFKALETAWNEADTDVCREHVTPFIRENSDKFNILSLSNREDYSRFRLTIDTFDDFKLIAAVVSHLKGTDFSWKDVVHFLLDHPEVAAINSMVKQKEV